MRTIATIFLTIFLAAGVQPVFAQAPGPEAHWDQFLSRHPGLAEHPQWLNNPTYMRQHPNMAKWLQEHPAVAYDARRQGMWDHQGNWHNSNWWHANNPSYASQYHPEWAQGHPDWASPGLANGPGPGVGDWDENHHWRAREWWIHHHRDWVERHHRDWLANNQEEREHHQH